MELAEWQHGLHGQDGPKGMFPYSIYLPLNVCHLFLKPKATFEGDWGVSRWAHWSSVEAFVKEIFFIQIPKSSFPIFLYFPFPETMLIKGQEPVEGENSLCSLLNLYRADHPQHPERAQLYLFALFDKGSLKLQPCQLPESHCMKRIKTLTNIKQNKQENLCIFINVATVFAGTTVT